MVRFIGVEITDIPQVPGVSSPSVPLWKKASLVFVKPRRRPESRYSVPLVQSMPKLSPVASLSSSS